MLLRAKYADPGVGHSQPLSHVTYFSDIVCFSPPVPAILRHCLACEPDRKAWHSFAVRCAVLMISPILHTLSSPLQARYRAGKACDENPQMY
jgi:hypothetical protein